MTSPAVLMYNARGAGFFSEMFSALNCIRLAEEQERVPVPMWSGRFLFKKPGNRNSWTGYFDPVWRPHKLDDCLASRDITTIEASGVRGLPNVHTPEGRRAVHRLISKYITLKGNVASKLKSVLERVDGDSTIAVHYRWTDRQKDKRLKMGFVSTQEFFKEIDEIRKPDEYIYLATDAEPTVQEFRSRYGKYLITADAVRSPDGKLSVHGSYDRGVKGSSYTKGLDVLVDAIAMAHCRYLIRSASQVSYYTCCLNPHLEYVDMHEKLGRYNPN